MRLAVWGWIAISARFMSWRRHGINLKSLKSHGSPFHHGGHIYFLTLKGSPLSCARS